ncbi:MULTISPECIES: hypothetical protein [Paenibacillus]|nr:hypothetical protein [Paenibacillus polymyxa]URJ40362.1 hypothetical protein MF627_005023 [Paenibacillus polymyxa]
MLRKGGDVPGKEVNGAYERLTSLPIEAGSFALPAVELRWLNLIRAGCFL